MSHSVHFRPATPTDQPALTPLILALYAEDGYAPMTTEKIARTFNELLQRPDKGGIHLGEVEGKVVAYAILIHYWSNEYGGNIATLDEIYTVPDWRGQGIASHFIDYLIQQPGLNPVAIQLEVTPDNLQAIAFYRKRGFVAADNRHFFRALHTQ
ncbi:MAG TPA: GNAT family N-acetyltransferase [Dongiaceae bacterium]|nr:GNAT family N-acetyltransferase [Dongiaceae bacterium]